MALHKGVVHVRASKRHTKSGKVVDVEAHTQSRDVLGEALKAQGRTPVAAKSGNYANGRSTPGSPRVFAAEKARRKAEIAAASARLKSAAQSVQPGKSAPKAKKLSATDAAKFRQIKQLADMHEKESKKGTSPLADSSHAESVKKDHSKQAEILKRLHATQDPAEIDKYAKSLDQSLRYNYSQLDGRANTNLDTARRLKDISSGKGTEFDGVKITGDTTSRKSPKTLKEAEAAVAQAREAENKASRAYQDAKGISEIFATSTKKDQAREAHRLAIADLRALQKGADKQAKKADMASSVKSLKKAGGNTKINSDAELKQHEADIQNEIDKLRAQAGDTLDRGSARDSEGNFLEDASGLRVLTPTRAALHQKILDAVFAKADKRGALKERKAIIAGGLPGAGKSFVLEKHAGVDRNKYITLNPDDFKEELAKYTTIPGTESGKFAPMEFADLLHEESSQLNKEAVARAEAQGYNIIHDVTLGGEGDRAKSKAEKTLRRIKANGYSTRGVFVNVDQQTSARRKAERYARGREDYKNGKGFGGRYVPGHVGAETPSKGFNSTNHENFDHVKKLGLFDSHDMYDNSVDGADPVLLERSGGPAETSKKSKSIEDIAKENQAKRNKGLSDSAKKLEQVMEAERKRRARGNK